VSGGLLNELQQKTGLSRQDLLHQFAQELPLAISAATPEGRVPQSAQELHAAARQPAPNA